MSFFPQPHVLAKKWGRGWTAPQGGEGPSPKPLVKDKFGAFRRKAKTLNFSIVYGKTVNGLAKDWGVTEDDARGRRSPQRLPSHPPACPPHVAVTEVWHNGGCQQSPGIKMCRLVWYGNKTGRNRKHVPPQHHLVPPTVEVASGFVIHSAWLQG